MSRAPHKTHYVPTEDGWSLELKQCRPPKKVDKKKRPILIVPGYGMNSFIFGYHPRGISMEEYFMHHGFEVWSANLRGQGGSTPAAEDGSGMKMSLKDLALTDLATAVDHVSEKSRSETGKVDLIGCSLGGTLAFLYAALDPNPHLGAIVAIGSPLRWEKVHPLLKMAFRSPTLVGMIPIRHVKERVRKLFPLILRSPLLRIYLHPEMVDTRHMDRLLETVENPNRHLNREIAEWILRKDLIMDGKNLSHAFRKVKNPLLCVLANADGIVPPMTALSAHELAGSKIKDTLVVGTDRLRFAHADLFVSNHSHEMVFKPIAEWLIGLYQ